MIADDHCRLWRGDGGGSWVPAIGPIHNVVTSRGRASDRHPSNSHDYHWDRLSVVRWTMHRSLRCHGSDSEPGKVRVR